MYEKKYDLLKTAKLVGQLERLLIMLFSSKIVIKKTFTSH